MKKSTERPEKTTTRDLLDLAEFPLGLLAEPRPGSGRATVEYRDGSKALTIMGHPDYGLPTPRDLEVYLVLQEIAERNGFAKRLPLFRAQVLQTLGWSTGSGYERLELSLRRWMYTRYQAVAAIHDPKTGDWEDHTDFGIVERIHERRRPGPLAPDEAHGWFEFSEAVRELLATKFFFRISAGEYLRLKSPLAQAEYRYLSAKRKDGKTQFAQNLLIFAQQHLGLRQSYPSKIQEKLAPAHAELIAMGFVETVEYGIAGTGEHAGLPKVTFLFPRKERFEGPEGTTAAPKSLPPPARHRDAPPTSGYGVNTMGAGSRSSPRIAPERAREAFPPIVARNGSPDDEKLELARRFLEGRKAGAE